MSFILAMVLSHPSLSAMTRGVLTPALGNSGYLYLLAANVGAVIMPWMIFYQQGAVIDKGLGAGDLRGERRATAFGALVTQVIMTAWGLCLVTMAFGLYMIPSLLGLTG